MTRRAPSQALHPLLRFAVLAGALTAAACDSDDRDARARTVSLVPSADDGAALVELVGAPVTSVTADGAQVFFQRHGDTTRVVVVRADPGPLRFDLLVEDPTETPVGTVLQVAGGDNRLRDAAGYRLEVSR